MPELALAAAVQAVSVGAGGTAPGCSAGPGMIAFALEGAAPARALGIARSFIGTPGADSVAAGRVIDTALGVIALLGPAAAFGRVSGAVLLVAALVAELVVAEVPGAVGAAAGGAADVTTAVIE